MIWVFFIAVGVLVIGAFAALVVGTGRLRPAVRGHDDPGRPGPLRGVRLRRDRRGPLRHRPARLPDGPGGRRARPAADQDRGARGRQRPPPLTHGRLPPHPPLRRATRDGVGRRDRLRGIRRLDAADPHAGGRGRSAAGLGVRGGQRPRPVRVLRLDARDRLGAPGCRRARAGSGSSRPGRLLGGWAEIRVEPEGAGTRLDWHEDVVVRPLPFKRVFAPVLDRASVWLYGRAVDAMLARAEERARRRTVRTAGERPHRRRGRPRPLRLGRLDARLPRLPRHRVGRAGPRRAGPLRAADARGLPVRARLDHDPAQARGVPGRLRRLRPRGRGDASTRTTGPG